ncbi:hypothetical protein M3Y99_00072400 [Aphelenchoides fujianensis]|nr:hypothetical protein M3Y99_00072400 [Aphelenchoides fujianensis]
MAARFPVDPSDLSTSYAATESDSSSSLLVHNHRLTVDFFEGYPPRHTILHPGTKKKRKRRSGCCCGRLLIAALGVCAFLLIWFVLSRHFGLRNFGFTPARTRGNRTNEEVREFLAKLVDGRRIRENNRWLSERPHVAGSEEQRELMDRIERRSECRFRQLGFQVRTHEYEVLLSAPDYDRPNRIHAFVNGELSDGLASGEPTADGRERHLWNAYAANGTAVGECVFANYGTNEDFDRLEEVSGDSAWLDESF